ncbi:MAG: hypothetical protein F6J95_009850 [Leptolyngbya sp. SIO1E4]|nr:hypothetical protein [Leptolyngbya sp. SIO1E4]
MKRKQTWQTLKLATVGLVMLGLSGCPEPSSPTLSHPVSATEAIPVAQAATSPAVGGDAGPQSVNFEVCGYLPDWERPDLETQTAELNNNPRYAGELDEDPLKSLSEKFWNEFIFTFTTYGLSARVEPTYLSGVWTAIDGMEACHGGDRPEAINQGQWAEMWLIGHQVLSIEWSGDHYQITVESTPRGLQFVQFERFETNGTLPIVVVEINGTEVAAISGDG